MNVTVDVRAEGILARIAGAPAAMMARLVREVERLSIALQSYVKSDKLTGQVLHVRTGTLRRSINRRLEKTDTSVTAIVGTNVRYARPHEFGFQGQVDVRGHTRQARSGAATAQEISVRAHTRRVSMPVRSFLRSALQDKEQEIRTDLRDAATRGLLGAR